MGRRARILLHLHIQREKIVLRRSRAGRHFGCRNLAGRHFGCRNLLSFVSVRTIKGRSSSPAGMCEGGGRGGKRRGRAFYYTYMYIGKM
jgi:hypothetical protein